MVRCALGVVFGFAACAGTAPEHETSAPAESVAHAPEPLAAVEPAPAWQSCSTAAGSGAASREVDVPRRTFPSVESPDPLVAWLRRVTATPLAELRPALLQGIERRELHRLRFDGSTTAECIDRVVAAAERHRERPIPDGTASELRRAIAAYVDARREAQVAASAGAASCMPEPR